jgi:hypothetical protein
MSKFIIGCGIAGLIAAYYRHDFKVIGDDIGGQMAKRGLGPRILEVNDNSANLLIDLGYEVVNIKTAKIGYFFENKFHDFITPEYRCQYYLKSRNLINASEVPDSIMSDGKNEIKYFDVEWSDLINRLVKAIGSRFIKATVKNIDLDNKKLKLNDRIGFEEYDELISTIPAPIFCKLAGIKPEAPLRAERKIFVIVAKNAIDMRDYDYIYYPESGLRFHRITNLGRNRAAIEYTGDEFKAGKVISKWGHIAVNCKELPNAQIKSGKMQEIPNVQFAGRYAEWNHDIKTDDLVERFREAEVE